METLNSKMFKDINIFLKQNIKYTKLSTSEQSVFVNNFKKIIKKHNVTLNPSQIIQIRDTFIYLLSKTKGTYVHRIGDTIFTEYKNKLPIIDIANKYELPPMSVVNQILIETKHESHKIEKMIKKQMLPKEIQIQMPEIMKSDPMFWFSCTIPNIHNKLNDLKCPYKLKYDLRKMGKCPDILFDTVCTYKRKSFNWIVFKPYTLFNNKLHMHDIQKTILNFNRFGVGLILYNEVICSKSFIKKIKVHIDTYNFMD